MLKAMGMATGGVVLAGCAAPTPQVIEKIVKETVQVEKPVEKVVKETVQVETTKVVEKQVQVTATPPPKGLVKIRFGTWANIFDELIDVFNKRYAGKIQCEKAITPWGGYNQKLLTQMAAGTAPDVNWVQFPYWFSTVNKDVFAPLDDLLASSKSDVAGLFADPKVWAGWKGKIYGIPAHPAAPFSPMYNIDLFTKAGVPMPKYEAWSLADFTAAAVAVKKLGDDIWGLTLMGISQMLSMIFSAGGRIITEDESKCVINSPETRGVLQAFVDFRQKLKVAPTPQQAQALGQQAFGSGKLGITWLPVGDWDSKLAWEKGASGVIPNDTTLTPLCPPGNKRVSAGQAHPLACPKLGKNIPEGFEFARYFVFEDEAIRVITKKIPGIYKIDKYFAEMPDEKQRAWFMRSLPYYKTFVPEWTGYSGGDARVDTILSEGWEKMVNGTQTVEAATDEMAKAIDPILAAPR
jgi:ABC-type glycerol-3-phosphate transport system substrate-binding protein